MQIVIDIDNELYQMCKDLHGDADPVESAIANGTPSKQKWIPIKEKRPNDSEDYIVTVNMGDVNCVVMDYYSIMWGCFEGYGKDVIAWMPLPKPYEPQESEGKDGK